MKVLQGGRGSQAEAGRVGWGVCSLEGRRPGGQGQEGGEEADAEETEPGLRLRSQDASEVKQNWPPESQIYFPVSENSPPEPEAETQPGQPPFSHPSLLPPASPGPPILTFSPPSAQPLPGHLLALPPPLPLLFSIVFTWQQRGLRCPL